MGNDHAVPKFKPNLLSPRKRGNYVKEGVKVVNYGAILYLPSFPPNPFLAVPDPSLCPGHLPVKDCIMLAL